MILRPEAGRNSKGYLTLVAASTIEKSPMADADLGASSVSIDDYRLQEAFANFILPELPMRLFVCLRKACRFCHSPAETNSPCFASKGRHCSKQPWPQPQDDFALLDMCHFACSIDAAHCERDFLHPLNTSDCAHAWACRPQCQLTTFHRTS